METKTGEKQNKKNNTIFVYSYNKYITGCIKKQVHAE